MLACNKAHSQRVREMGGSHSGSIMDVETTGASSETAKGDNLSCTGVQASYLMALHDADEMEEYEDIIKQAARDTGVDASVIAGIISRETRAGRDPGFVRGWGDNGKAWGLMQIDVTKDGGNHDVGNTGWDSVEHLKQACGILKDCIEQIKEKPSFNTPEKQLKGGLAAYNQGAGNVHTYARVDVNTTHKDYSNDVIARAQWFKDIRGY